MKKPEPNYTIKTLLEELERSGSNLRNSSKGHRALLRSSLQTAQRIIVKFSDDKTLRSQFVSAVKKARNRRKKSAAINWPLEVVAKATGASSRKARKLASKRAGVLEYLRERGVAVKDTAITVKKEGLEKLYSAWCKKKREALADAGKASKREKARNDKEVILPLRMRMSERDQLLDQKLGTKLTMLVSRVSKDDGDLQVRRVMAANSLGDASDWDD
ncbi:hypothetical protein [Bradyrhizobium sp. SZCCHNRI3043]|uniref:hypothetical protein n=1 Tax=Bradyrhizobium sp. SZCCHNRI3043 TaxID=3057292 RepID=UPI0028EBC415|nr:hypothetical protein [Bradyrhizobium sp. SZCCHNRI3043]